MLGMESWNSKRPAQKSDTEWSHIRQREQELERAVTQYIGRMPFIWLSVDDPPAPESDRGFIERNAIALLSNVDREAIDHPSPEWLGWHSDRPKVRRSGIWNNDHVDEAYDPRLFKVFSTHLRNDAIVKQRVTPAAPQSAN
jgi:hypothetical protein